MMRITYKIDVERLLQQNDRKVLLEIIPNEVREYELTEKKYGKEEQV